VSGAPPVPVPSLILTRVCDGAAAPEASQVMRQFPPRPRPGAWPGTRLDREQVSGLLLAGPFPLDSYGAQRQRAASLRRVLDWLDGQPGTTWQERWTATGAGGTARWRDLVPGFAHRGHGPAGGVLLLICGDVIRPGAGWLLESSGRRLLTAEMTRTRDPAGFTRLRKICAAGQISELIGDLSLRRIAAIMAAKGGTAGDITAGDCLELASAVSVREGPRGKGLYFCQLLRAAGVFPPQAPASVRMFATRGQLSPAELIGQDGIECGPVRDLLVDYLQEHQLAVDYATLRAMAHTLGSLFWRDLERHHPGISSLRLSAAVAAGWKQRITRKTGTGTGRSRRFRADGAAGVLGRGLVHGARVLPGHRPVGGRRPGPVGAVGRAMPGPRGRNPACQGGVPPQGPDGPADPRTAAGPACAAQTRRR
jgi:hypothetical protein